MVEALQNATVIRLSIAGLLTLGVFVIRRLAARWILSDTHIIQEHQRRQRFWLRTAITGLLIVRSRRRRFLG